MQEELKQFLTPRRIAQLGSTTLGRQMTETEASMFLELFGSQLADRLGNCVRDFVRVKLLG